MNEHTPSPYGMGSPLDACEDDLERLERINADLLAALDMVTDGYGHTWPVRVLEIVNAARVKAKG